MDDVKCVEGCLSGDPACISAFVERFHAHLFSFCLRRLGNREDAEDAAQQTLVRSIRYLDRWDQSRPLKPWVFKIALNCCRTQLIRRSRQIPIGGAVDEVVRKPEANAAIEIAEELHLALAKIREEHRICFELFHLQELSVKAISEMMQCPEGTVKTWLHRARFELARLLVGRGVTSKDGYELQ